MNLLNADWIRDPGNPVLPPGAPDDADASRCMNPFVLRHEDRLRMYYSGGDSQGRQRICLAEMPVDDCNAFTRHGAILDVGLSGSFDAHWCVLPCVHKFGENWHLYYTGNEGSDLGLQSFPGIGLAVSQDGIHFERHSVEPVITGNMTSEFSENRGVAGGGTILEETLADGSIEYRMFYTVAVGRPDSDIRIDQEKHCAVCHSRDGITWTDHRIVLSPRPDVSSEDAAVAAPFTWQEDDGYRMLYCGIGTRWGYYSISEAVSSDGYEWSRGSGDENLSLVPGDPDTWESQMVEYPSVMRTDETYRLFYCGNGYGRTGIGTAIAARKQKGSR
jgi:predicted GH43/DUF377 family glycosyl hydrolase